MTSPLAAHGHAFWSSLSAWDWVQFGIEVAIFVWVLWLAIKWTLRPGEEEPDHVKRSILSDDDLLTVVIAGAVPAGRIPSPTPGPSAQDPRPPKA